MLPRFTLGAGVKNTALPELEQLWIGGGTGGRIKRRLQRA